MTKAKKNSGCINCEYYYTNHHGGFFEGCKSKLKLKRTTGNDYLNGVIDTTMEYYPPRENKNLTCKGHTPIDWKARYDKLKKEIDEKPVEITPPPNKGWEFESTSALIGFIMACIMLVLTYFICN